jgi:hypothetical protein
MRCLAIFMLRWKNALQTIKRHTLKQHVAMNYQTYQPHSDLTSLAKFCWTLEVPFDPQNKKQKIVPDGCIEAEISSSESLAPSPFSSKALNSIVLRIIIPPALRS